MIENGQWNEYIRERWRLAWGSEVFSHHEKVDFLPLDQIRNMVLSQSLNTRSFLHYLSPLHVSTHSPTTTTNNNLSKSIYTTTTYSILIVLKTPRK